MLAAYEGAIAANVLRGDVDLAREYALDLARLRDCYLSVDELIGAHDARTTIS